MQLQVLGADSPRCNTGVSKRPDRSKIIQRSICLGNALRLPNLIRRTPDQNSCSALLGWKVMQGSPGVNQGSNYIEIALWAPNLVGIILDQSVMNCWGQRSCRGQLGSTNLIDNTLWPPNLVGRTPDQSVMQCWGQRSCRGHLGSTRDQIV